LSPPPASAEPLVAGAAEAAAEAVVAELAFAEAFAEAEVVVLEEPVDFADADPDEAVPASDPQPKSPRLTNNASPTPLANRFMKRLLWCTRDLRSGHPTLSANRPFERAPDGCARAHGRGGSDRVGEPLVVLRSRPL